MEIPGLPTEAKFALVDVFMTNSKADHYSINLVVMLMMEARRGSPVVGDHRRLSQARVKIAREFT